MRPKKKLHLLALFLYAKDRQKYFLMLLNKKKSIKFALLGFGYKNKARKCKLWMVWTRDVNSFIQ